MLDILITALLAHETLDAQRILEDSGLPPGPAPETDHLAVCWRGSPERSHSDHR